MSTKRYVDVDFTQRLRGVIGNESVRAFAMRAGLSAPAVHGYLNGTDPGRSALAAMAKAGRVSGGYLAFGDAEPHSTFLLPGGLPQDAGDAVVIPAYEGPGMDQSSATSLVGYIALSKNWLQLTFRTHPEHMRLFSPLSGLEAGDMAIGDINVDGAIVGDGTYVVAEADRLGARLFQRLPGGKIQVKSRNPDFEPITVPESRLADAGFRMVARLILIWAARSV
jgi:hypothetical protein